MSLYRKIYVRWIDSQCGPCGWETSEDMEPLKPGVCETVGFLLEDTKKYLTLCSSYNRDPSEERQINILSRITIPKCSIIEQKKIKY